MDIRTRSKAVSFVIILAFALMLLVAALSQNESPLGFMKVQSPKDAAEFLNHLGWESDFTAIETKESRLPDQFDSIFIDYNTLQLQQGCDLTKYAGKSVTIYTAPIINFSSSENIYSVLITHKGNVIGGDIHSAAMDGFIQPLI